MRKLAGQSLAGALALMAVLAWFFLAPTSLGGSTTYVVTDGISMLPHFHGGDLALIRGESSYHVGEIVAYHSTMLDTIVLHRIVGRDGDRYIFKGDNNTFLDVEHPTRSQLVGKLWLHLPGMGSKLRPLRNPLVVAFFAALAALLGLGGAFERKRRRRRRRGGEAPPARTPAGDWRAPVLVAGLAALMSFGPLAIVSFGRPAAGPTPVSVPYRQSGTFSYSARAAAGTAYPAGHAATGDPLFLKLVDAVRFAFAYRFDSAPAHQVRGTGSLAATLASSTGWSRTLRLEAPTPFAGDRVTLHGSLRLAELTALQQELATSTGTPGSYTLTLVPHVRVHGVAGGLPLRAAFSIPLSFSFDSFELQPQTSDPASGVTTSAPPDALTPSASGSATGTKQGPLVLSFGFFRAGVSGVRRLAMLGLGAAMLCLLLGYPAGVARLRRRSQGEADRIRARYSHVIVPIARLDEVPQRRVVHVSDIDALARVAERYERMILHERRGGRDSFCVSDDGVLYRYVVDDRSHGEPPPPVQLRRA